MPSTNTADPLAILLAHDRWATLQLFDVAATLDDHAFHRRFGIGLGSLHDTLSHIVSVERGWTSALDPNVAASWLEIKVRRTVGELRTMHEAAAVELEKAARSLPFDETITVQRGEKTFVFPRSVIVTHVITHSMHHRAQALNILKQLGVESLPMSAVTQWSWSTENGANV